MLVSLGMMVASYCLARLSLAPLTLPGTTPPSRAVRLTVCLIAALGCLGVICCAWELLGQGTGRNDARPRVEMR